MTTEELVDILTLREKTNYLFVDLECNPPWQSFLKIIDILAKGDRIHIIVKPIIGNEE